MVDAKLYPQSIYFYSQTVEKAAKSIIAMYYTSYENKTESYALKQIRGYSHSLLALTSDVSRIFTDIDNDLISKRGETETEESQNLRLEISGIIDSLKNYAQTGNMKALIVAYASNVRAIHELFNHLKNPAPGEHQMLKSVREKIQDPKARYIKFNMLAMYLFPLLDGMEIYSRYPMHQVDTNNVTLLSTPEVGNSCVLLKEMVVDLIELVPLVWNRLKTVKGQL